MDKKVVPNGELDKPWAITPGQKTNYDGVKSPTIDGYTPDKETVPSTPVTQYDINVTVTYTKNGTTKINQQNVDASQLVKYVDEDGKELRPEKSQKFEFNYSGDTKDEQTGKVTKDGKWNAENHDFTAEDVPVIDGYYAFSGYTKTADGKIVAGGLTSTRDNFNVTATVVYHKLGKIVSVDPNNKPIPDAPQPPYKKDPTDPTKVVPNEPVPEIPNKTPEVLTSLFKNLKTWVTYTLALT